jgi:outer membrane protein OmpA-like peptidoglycan-associated protein
MRCHALTLVVALAVWGCASTAPPAPSAPATADRKTATAEALAVERQWLQAWFRGTPVRVGQRSDGAVTVDVPREFCFEPGRGAVKPALAAVLDKVAESLRRVPLARVQLVAAPDDAGGASPLALQRATQVRDYLGSRGVPAARLGKPSVATAAAVQLRMEDAAP